jgi:hypothetical protein
VHGTLFLTKNWVNKSGTSVTWNDTYITQAQVQTIKTAGHELATHGVNHEDLAAYRSANGSAALYALVQQGVDYIEQTYSVTVKTGAYPAGSSDPQTREVMARNHEFYRGTKGVVAARGQDPFDVQAIDIQTLSQSAIQALVDSAVATRSMCVFLVHGGLTGADIIKYGNVIDYIQGLGVRMGTFYQGMLERTSLRGSAGAMVDTSGNAYFASVRSPRLEVWRGDTLSDNAWLTMDTLTNQPYFDSAAGNTWEFRKPVRAASSLLAGQRNVFGDAVTTTSSTTLTSGSAGFDAADVGRTISGTGIQAGTTIATVVSTTAVTLSQVATATATSVLITLGRSTAGAATFAKQADFYGGINLFSGSTPSIIFNSLTTGSQGTIGPLTWSRSGAGGAMLWDTGTGGSNADVKAFRFRLIDHTGVRRLALATAQPNDASLNNGECALYFDGASGTLRFRGKNDAGTIVQATVTTS